MKRIVGILLFVAVWVGTGDSQGTSAKLQPTFVIQGPTIVAFFATETEKDSKSDSEDNEALSDFQFYAGEVKDRLHKAGIEFHEAYALSFRIRIGNTVRTYWTRKAGVGYYFVAPGKMPHIVSGVMTSGDLLDAAGKYFGISIQ